MIVELTKQQAINSPYLILLIKIQYNLCLVIFVILYMQMQMQLLWNIGSNPPPKKKPPTKLTV